MLWGLNPLGYHLVNVLLHAANAMLVWMALKRLAVPAAWLAAAFFALHPVEVESVAWVTELKNIQSTLFYLLAILAWIQFLDRGPTSRWKFYALALFLYLLALLSKTTACTFPAALVLILWIRNERIGRPRILQIVPFIILGVAAGVVSIWWESHLGNYQEDVGQNLTLLQRVLIASHALWFYFWKLVWPVNLAFSYSHWQVDVGKLANYLWLAGCLAVMGMLWLWRKTCGRRIIAAVIFFVATLSPLLGFIPLYTFRYSYVADHYQYVAGIGLLALAAAALNRAPRIISVIVLVALAGLTWKQAHIYRNQTILWQDTLAKNPASWMADNNLGQVYKNEGDLGRAISFYRQAIHLKPDFAEGHYNLGIALFRDGQTNEAMIEFREAIRLNPRDSRAFFNYAIALDESGQTDAAIRQYQQAISLNPDYTDAHINLGIVFSRQDKVDEAITQFQDAVNLRPDDAEAHNNLGAVLRAKGRLDDAIEQFQTTLHLDPNYALAHANLGGAFLEKGRTNEAISQLQEAIALDPNDLVSRRILAAALRQSTPQ